MSDPYRGAIAMRCLICKDGPLDADGDGFRCPKGCGLWDPTIPRAEGGKSLATLGRAIEHQLHPRKCPSCEERMEIRRWSRLTFDVCPRHGVWVAGDDIAYYRQLTS
jgi:hypothetical protein